MSCRITRLPTLAIVMVSLGGSATPAESRLGVEGGRLRLSACQDLPTVPLRGYGPLSGCQWTAPTSGLTDDGRPTVADSGGVGRPAPSPRSAPSPNQPAAASLLQINCASDSQAQLLLAKYLSDLGLLPGVRAVPLVTKRGPCSAREIENQGAIAALRSESHVVILAARTTADLQTLYEDNLPADLAIHASEAEVPVPGYLDRWISTASAFTTARSRVPAEPTGARSSRTTRCRISSLPATPATRVWSSGIRPTSPKRPKA